MTTNAVDEVKDKVAIVTGAASGIGRATTELLHARGAKVVAEDISPDVEKLERPGIATLVADVSQDGSAEKAVALALGRFGRLDILVNNAGVIINKFVVDMTRQDWERIMAVNATGAFLHSREAMRAMIPNKSGAIVNIASYASFRLPEDRGLRGLERRVGAAHPDPCARSDRARHSRERDRLGRRGYQHPQRRS
jgi:NAD(P)-dependent dehydrogenase (short-subunit alcohol dehydrogenase family)